MVQQVKQCAGCGAQMGTRGRVCPRCGRGSLFGELVWIAVLGILLLGIGVLSGLVPVDRIPVLAQFVPAAPEPATSPPAPPAASVRRPARKPARVETVSPAKPALVYAPCNGSDTERAPQVSASHNGPHSPARLPCREPADTSHHPEAPPPVP